MGAPSNSGRDHVMHAGRERPKPCVPHAAWRGAVVLLAFFSFTLAQAASPRAAKQGAHGAIALERETGQVGYAYNAASSRAAKMEALRQCSSARCEVVVSFSNACGGLARDRARGAKGYFPATGATRQEAEAKALRLCAAKACELAAWACTR